MRVVFKRDFLVSLRLSGGLTSFISLLFDVGALYYLTRSIGPGYRPEGIDYFAFATVGTAYVTFLLAGMAAFVQVIQEFQNNGVLEVAMTGRTGPVMVVTLNAAPTVLRHGVTLLVTFLTAYAVISGVPPPFDPVSSTVVFVLSLLLIAPFGILAAIVQMLTRKGQIVLWFAGSVGWFLGGTMYPVGALPDRLQQLSRFVPITYAIDAFRAAIVKGAHLSELRGQILVMVLLILTLWPISIFFFNVALRATRRNGLLNLY